MSYIAPILSVIVSYTFMFLAIAISGNEYDPAPIGMLLPFIMGIVNLIVVLTAGRKWSRKTLLNCTLIIKYGLIPLYLLGGSFATLLVALAIVPLPMMAISGVIAAIFLIYGYGMLLGSAPYAIAYIVKSYKEGVYSNTLSVVCGICQFFFCLDVCTMMALTIKERHAIKTTIAVIVLACIIILLIVLYLVVSMIIAS